MNLLQRILILITLLLVFGIESNAQTASPSDVSAGKQELADKDISEQEIKDKLMTKGIDLDNLKPSQLPTIEADIQQVILEIEQEKSAASEVVKDVKVFAKDTVAEEKEAEIEPIVEKEESKEPEEPSNVEEKVEEIFDPKAYVFGQHLFFNNTISSFTTVNSNAVPNTYVLDAGDRLAVNIFGTSQADLLYEIEEDGFIRPAGLYKIYLRGVTFGDAKMMLRKRFALAYKFQKDQFNVSLTASRTVNVNIYGEVNKPGSYTISALNNVFNAIMVAGGPNVKGSVRNIKIISNGKERTIDFYDYLTNPNTTKNLSMSEGDIIFLPVIVKKVNSIGNTFKDGNWIYELKENENFNEFILIVGGVVDVDLIQTVQHITREGDQKVYYDYTFEEASSKNLKLKNNDVIRMQSGMIDSYNYFSVNGAVRVPGNFQFKDGDRVSDAIDRAVLKRETNSDIAFISRIYFDGTTKLIKVNVKAILDGDESANIALQGRDKVHFSLMSDFQDTSQISIRGAVRKPGNFNVSNKDSITINDLIFLASGLEVFSTDFGYIVSKDIKNAKLTSYKIINLKEAVDQPKSLSNVMLKPGDQLVVPKSMEYSDQFSVKITGAVRDPGTFKFSKGDTFRISDLIFLAKGLKETATQFGFVVSQDITNSNLGGYKIVNLKKAFEDPKSEANILLNPRDKLVVPTNMDYTDDFVVKISGAVRKPNTFKYNEDLKLQEVIVLAGGLKLEAATNRIDIYRLDITENEPTTTLSYSITVNRDIDPLNIGSDFKLEPFDHIVIRSAPEFENIRYVTIKGEVRYPGIYALLTENERISDIINRAEGLTNESFPEGGTILRRQGGFSGRVVTRLDKAVAENKRHNLVLKGGDIITIPKTMDVISIDRIGTNTITDLEVNSNEIDSTDTKLNVQINYRAKRAKWYINKFGGGFSKDAKRSMTKVIYPNGQVKRTRDFGLFKIYPKVRRGSEIRLALKDNKDLSPDERKDNAAQRRERIDRIIDSSTALLSLATAAITTMILADRL